MNMANFLSLGESMARLSSFDGQRLSDSAQLDLTYGGAEGNVAANLSQLDHEVKYATKVPQNPLSSNLIAHMKSYGVDCSNILIGGDRLGTYFLEVGAGVRPSSIVYDRAYSAISMMTELEWDLDELFDGVEYFHITGITLGISPEWHKLGVELMKEAKSRGIKVSFDMNYRQKLWDHDEAKRTFEELLPYVDYLNAGKLDAIHFIGVPEDENEGWEYYTKAMAKEYPNIEYIYGTNRENITSNSFNINGYLYDTKNDQSYESKEYRLDIVIDRVGAGDSYAAGILDGIMNNHLMEQTVEFGMASSVLKHTIQGDVNRFSREEIESFMSNNQNIIR